MIKKCIIKKGFWYAIKTIKKSNKFIWKDFLLVTSSNIYEGKITIRYSWINQNHIIGN